MRQLGIPTVMDLFVQQALYQVMQPIFKPDFSESSYGFSPDRHAQRGFRKRRACILSVPGHPAKCGSADAEAAMPPDFVLAAHTISGILMRAFS